MARDAGRERMLIGVLRTLGAVSENSTSNASRVIAARGLVPAFQLLSSRLPAVRQALQTASSCSQRIRLSLIFICGNAAFLSKLDWPDRSLLSTGSSIHTGLPFQ